MNSDSSANSSTIEADLSAVRGLMEQSSRAIHDSGWHHVVWGSVVATATLLVRGVAGDWPAANPGWTWAVAVALGWVLSVVAGRAAYQERPATTGADSVTRRVWVAVGISLTLLGFVGIPTGSITSSGLSTVTAVLLAMGYFASSVGPDLRWFLGLAVAWWGGAVVLLLLPRDITQLAFAGMMLVIEVGVGLALIARNRSGAVSAPAQSV